MNDFDRYQNSQNRYKVTDCNDLFEDIRAGAELEDFGIDCCELCINPSRIQDKDKGKWS